MSKRHQSNRRKSYGRRQHELHERQPARPRSPTDVERVLDDVAPAPMSDRFSFMDTRSTRLRYALGD